MGNSCGNCNNSEENKKEELVPDEETKSQAKPAKCPFVSEEVKEVLKKRPTEKYSKKSDDIFGPENNEQHESKSNSNAKQKVLINPQAKNTDINLNSLQKVFSEAFIPAAGLNNAKTLMPLPYTEEEKLLDYHPQPQTLYEKFGGREGMNTFISMQMGKIMGDPQLSVFFRGKDVDLVAEKFKQYMTFLTGGQPHWIGMSMKDAHRNIHVTDEMFDKFIQYMVQVLKQMKVKMDCLKEAVIVVGSVRDQIVKQEEPKKVAIFDQLGQMEGINHITEFIYEKIYNDEEVSSFFKKTNQQQQKKRFAYFLAAATGGPVEWIGKTMKEAHRGRGIKEKHFMMVGTYLMMALDQFGVDKTIQQKIFEQIYILKKDIVEPKTLYEKIIDIVPLETVINKFVQKLFSHPKLQKSFHFVESSALAKIFSNELGQQYDGKLQMLVSDRDLPKDDVDYAIFILKQVLLEYQFDQHTSDEMCEVFDKITKNVKVEQEQQADEEIAIHVEEVVEEFEEEEDNDNNNSVSSPDTKKRGNQNTIISADQSPNFHQQSQSKQALEIEKVIYEDQKIVTMTEVFEQQHQAQNDNEKQQSEPGRQPGEDHIQDDEQCQVVRKHSSNKQAQQSLEIEIDKNIQLPESPISNRSSPMLNYKKQKQFKYILSDLLCEIRNDTQKKDLPTKGTIIYQGELQRFMEKQKSQLPRWLILNAKALLIYKDQMHSKSFPYKPLYAIPLPEVKSVSMKEVSFMPNPRKSQILHSIEIELQDKYGCIAENIAQLVSSFLLSKPGGEGGYSSPLKDRNNKNIKSSNNQQQQQSHGYEDSFLVFVSSSKKDTLKWHKLLTEQCKTKAEESQAEQIAIIEEIEKAQIEVQNQNKTEDQQLTSLTYS